jgi:hypothetical protein
MRDHLDHSDRQFQVPSTRHLVNRRMGISVGMAAGVWQTRLAVFWP